MHLRSFWIEKYLAMSRLALHHARIKIMTTSDWTTLNIVSGAAWMRPERVSASSTVTKAGMEAGDRFILTQSLADANAGKEVEMIWDVSLADLVDGQDLILQIDLGHIGSTQVTIYNNTGSTPMELQTFEWDRITTDRNSYQSPIPSNMLIEDFSP